MNKMSEDFGKDVDKFFDKGIKPYRRAIEYMDDVSREGQATLEHFDPYISEENRKLVNKRKDNLETLKKKDDSNLIEPIKTIDAGEER